MKRISIIAIVLSAFVLLFQIFIFATNTATVENTKYTKIRDSYGVYSPEIPDTMNFCGEKIPLDDFYVHEGLDRELTIMMYNYSSTMLIIKRAGRVFPEIEPILRKNKVPIDLKYLCVIESSLMNLTSSAKAQGYWQFMKPTAQSFGLEINNDVDMRNDLEASTNAACKFLKSLRSRLGNWPAAAAAYNCGENGLNKCINAQGTKTYFETRLNNETTRYVFRILAAKLILQNPQKYGFFIHKYELYPQIPYRTVELSGKNVDIIAFAKENKTSYKMIRMLNPWILGDKIENKANKTYKVKIPTEISWKRLTKSSNNSFVTSL